MKSESTFEKSLPRCEEYRGAFETLQKKASDTCLGHFCDTNLLYRKNDLRDYSTEPIKELTLFQNKFCSKKSDRSARKWKPALKRCFFREKV